MLIMYPDENIGKSKLSSVKTKILFPNLVFSRLKNFFFIIVSYANMAFLLIILFCQYDCIFSLMLLKIDFSYFFYTGLIKFLLMVPNYTTTL